MIHIHARTPEGVPSYEIDDFRAITEAIRGAVDDVVINYSTGAIGVPIEKRIEYLRELRPDVGALNMGSMNYAKYSSRRKDFVFKTVFENSFDTIIEFLEAMNELDIRPEHECFDSGHVANLDPLLDMGLLSEPLQISCVMGVNGGIRPTPQNLAHMAGQVPGGAESANNWGVIGIGRGQWRLVAAAAAYGGNVRVGLEDNFYLPDGEMAGSNGDLIARARRLVEDVGRRAATVEEARELLAAPRRVGSMTRRPGRPAGARPVPAAAGRVLLAAAGRPRSRRAQGRGHRHGRLRALVAALPRGSRGLGQVGAVPGAQPRQALDPPEPQGGARPGGAAAAGERARRAAGVVPARRDGAPGRGLRAPHGGEPGAGVLRDQRLRPGRSLHGPVRSRHELPGAQRPAGPHRRRGRPAGAVGRPDRRPGRRRADGRRGDPGRPARARALRRGPARGRVDVRRLALVAGAGGGEVPVRGQRCPARGARARGPLSLLPALRLPRRLGDPGRAGAQVLAGLVQRRGARGPDRAPVRPARLGRPRRGGARSSPSAPAPTGTTSPSATTAASSRCSAWTRRSTPSWSGPARWWWSWTSRAPTG